MNKKLAQMQVCHNPFYQRGIQKDKVFPPFIYLTHTFLKNSYAENGVMPASAYRSRSLIFLHVHQI